MDVKRFTLEVPRDMLEQFDRIRGAIPRAKAIRNLMRRLVKGEIRFSSSWRED